jgi:hypothetical protein
MWAFFVYRSCRICSHSVDSPDNNKNHKGDNENDNCIIRRNLIMAPAFLASAIEAYGACTVPSLRTINRLEKSTLPRSRPIGGIKTSETNEVTGWRAAQSLFQQPYQLHALRTDS